MLVVGIIVVVVTVALVVLVMVWGGINDGAGDVMIAVMVLARILWWR